nr:protein p11,lower collar [Bacillus phage phi29]
MFHVEHRTVKQMSSYTMQLRTYIEMWSQGETGLSTAEKIEKGRPKLFDFNYPIFDESYRTIFETHFIRNFYMREIGFETEGLFKFHLETWLMINMPYFNK